MRGVPIIYRTPLIVIPKQPFLDWVQSLGDEVSGIDPIRLSLAERYVFLIRVPERDSLVGELVADYWPDMFEEQLVGWTTDERRWPADRTRAMFDAWFEVETAQFIVDLVPEEPFTEDEVDAADAEAVMRECAWCGAELEDAAGRMAGFRIDRPERIADLSGRVLSVAVDRDRVIHGIVTPLDSDFAAGGEHVLFKVCSRDCERALKSVAPRALRKAMRSIPDVH